MMIRNDILHAKSQNIALACQESKLEMDSTRLNILSTGVSVKADASVSIESVKMDMKIDAIAQNRSSVAQIN
jgi:hypothetical protein